MRVLTVINRISLLLILIFWGAAAHAADDTARFYGIWETTFPYNGQLVTIVSVHDENGYSNVVRTPTGDAPPVTGTFSAANGKWTSNAAPPNNVGIYHFVSNDIVVTTNAVGQVVTWKRKKEAPAAAGSGPVDANVAAKRVTGYIPPASRPGTFNEPPAPPPQPELPAAKSQPSAGTDASLSPGMNAGMQAMQRKDYVTAWREFMAEAQKGSSDGEAAVGSMLFQKTNPPGTGYYAQCEKWLLASAKQGNRHGMDMLAQYYFNEGRNIAGGINPGVNTAPIPPQQQAQAEAKFKLAREWFERSAAQGDIYAMGNLAIMLDSGVGGPKDPARAAQLREQVKRGPDANFAKRATVDPSNLAISASWQSGHYADAIKGAMADAQKGDANAQALLGRAYYEGVGVPRNFATALGWLNKAVAQGNADGMFFLGLMYEHGAGVNQDLPKSLDLFDRAGEKGQRYAQMEAKGMRMQGEANQQAARAHHGGVMETACSTAGGISIDSGECLKGGGSIDPFNPQTYSGADGGAVGE
jgi:TPR repeat protein